MVNSANNVSKAIAYLTQTIRKDQSAGRAMKLFVEEQKRKTKGELLEGQVKSGRPTILTTDEEAGARFN